MEPNNFEKKIQQKMDELKIPPSDLVWTNIEKRIGKKHKDRKAIFIIFFLILFLFTGGYWLFNSTKNNTQQQSHPLSNLLENNKPTLHAGEQANKYDSGHSIVSSIRLPAKEDTSQSVVNKRQKKISLKGSFVTEERASASFQNKELKRETNSSGEKHIKVSGENNQQESQAKIEHISNQNLVEQNKNKEDSLLKKKEEKLTAKKTSEDEQKHKWIFGARFSGGMSFISNELLDINNISSDYLSTPNSGSGNSGSGAPSGLPVKTINSKAVIAGIFIEKNISKKNKISLGINYKYFSTINKTGNKIDSAQTAYTSISYTNTYRNNFNYLELPVSLKFQLTNNNSLPVYWLAGINISQLISSDALQFKSDPGIYYKDNSLFNKTQWGFSTGFFATFFSQKKTPVNIGPYFYYNATRLSNEGLYDKKHFHFIGIRAEILFNKK